MKKIVRLTETDVQRLVKKIIREEKKSINEGGLFDWVRGKRFSDEERNKIEDVDSIFKQLEDK
jgi:hypothetical protein